MAESSLPLQASAFSFMTSFISQPSSSPGAARHHAIEWDMNGRHGSSGESPWGEASINTFGALGSTGKGILIGMMSAFGSAALVGVVFAVVYFLRYTSRGRILLDRISRPGEFDDEQQFLREEEEALAEMDDMSRAEYMRAKAFVQVNPPESAQTDISLSQFLAIQEKGVSAWEFEPELEIANCFVEARTEIEFFDSECSVQSNLPIPKQNEVYYFETKLYDKPESTLVSIGLTTKPYPLFRLPGFHRSSVAYTSTGQRRYNQPFAGTNYAPSFVQGDVIGLGYRPRTGTIFFTRNGKKLDDVAHGLKTQNFFPTIGANGPCNVHVNFGQSGFVFIEANVKKWGLAPMTGSLAPPPPYGSEAGSILLEGGREGVREGQGLAAPAWMPGGHARTSSAQLRLAQSRPARSPGPVRSPTDISLSRFDIRSTTPHNDDDDDADDDDDDEYIYRDGGVADDDNPNNLGEGTSHHYHHQQQQQHQHFLMLNPGLPLEPADQPPPDYESPAEDNGLAGDDDDDTDSTPRASDVSTTSNASSADPQQRQKQRRRTEDRSPPIPTYEAATSDIRAGRGRSATRNTRGWH